MTGQLRRRLSAAALRAGRHPLRAHDGPVRLDGGASTSLAARGHDCSGPLWSARLLDDAPDAVRRVHADFLTAGAEVVTTLSYQLAATSMAAAGRDPADTPRLLRKSVQLARDAVDAHDAPALVAASIGPYGAVLADGSEYRGGYGIDRTSLSRFHRERLEVLVDTDTDLLVCETVPSAVELEVLAEVLAQIDLPVLVGVTLGPDGASTAEGQPLTDALSPLAALGHVVAVGVNCVPQRLVVPAVSALSGLGPSVLAKPNAQDEPLGDPGPWVAAGAALVGGCCGTGPKDLARLFHRLA